MPEMVTPADKNETDHSAYSLYPDDFPSAADLHPCKSKADGNCLPSSASCIAYNTLDRATKMRVHIVVESVVNDMLYLNRDLSSGSHGD